MVFIHDVMPNFSSLVSKYTPAKYLYLSDYDSITQIRNDVEALEMEVL